MFRLRIGDLQINHACALTKQSTTDIKITPWRASTPKIKKNPLEYFTLIVVYWKEKWSTCERRREKNNGDSKGKGIENERALKIFRLHDRWICLCVCNVSYTSHHLHQLWVADVFDVLCRWNFYSLSLSLGRLSAARKVFSSFFIVFILSECVCFFYIIVSWSLVKAFLRKKTRLPETTWILSLFSWWISFWWPSLMISLPDVLKQ